MPTFRLLAVSFLLLGLLPSPVWAQLINPGPLHKTHQELSGENKCAECHSSGKRVAQSLCLICHDDIGNTLIQKTGLHGRNYRDKACEKCHVEHIGKNSRLIRWPQGRREALDHRLTGWTLKGSHKSTKCDDCHTSTNRRGNNTYLGLKTDCVACHEDPHDSRLGNKCETCHVEVDWKTGATDDFDHKLARFDLTGKHVKVECDKCHGKPPRWTGLQFDDCDACHQDPHKGRLEPKSCDSCHRDTGWNKLPGFRTKHPGVSLQNGHRKVACKTCHDAGNLVKPRKGSSCVACHDPVHTARFGQNCKDCHESIQWLGLPESVGRENHGKTRYPLFGQHVRTDCAGCHPPNKKPAARYRNLAFDKCRRCHDDPHKKEFAKRDKGECAPCHDVAGFWPTRFGTNDHKKTSFPLLGRHRGTPCSACHEGKRPRTTLTIAKKKCADCHDNPHGDQFAEEMKENGCATCHNPRSWTQPDIDHSIWPLTGAHADTSCEACHMASPEDRKRGSGATYKGAPRECAGCHMDIHLGQFRLSEPVRPCDFCHDTDEFLIDPFEHLDKTSFDLTGKHSDLECKQCHVKQGFAKGQDAVRYRLGYRACADCHANPHKER